MSIVTSIKGSIDRLRTAPKRCVLAAERQARVGLKRTKRAVRKV